MAVAAMVAADAVATEAVMTQLTTGTQVAASEHQMARLVAPKAEEGSAAMQVAVAAALAEEATVLGSRVVAAATEAAVETDEDVTGGVTGRVCLEGGVAMLLGSRQVTDTLEPR